MAIADVTESVAAGASRLTEEERADFDRIAPKRLGMIQTNDFVSDVRFLPNDEGFASGNRTSFCEYSFTTILEDGFVVTTDAIVGERGIMGRFASIGIFRLDPGFMIFEGKSSEAIRVLHVDRVAAFVASRKSPARTDHSRELYFEFRKKRSRQILRRAFFQFVTMGIVWAVALSPSLANRLPFGAANHWMVGVLSTVFGFVLGTTIDIALRGSSPMLRPKNS